MVFISMEAEFQAAAAQIDNIKATIQEYVSLMSTSTSDSIKEARSRGKELQRPIIDWFKGSGVDIVDVGTHYVKLVQRKRKAVPKKEGISEKAVQVLMKYMDREEAIKVSNEISSSIQETRETIAKETIQIKKK